MRWFDTVLYPQLRAFSEKDRQHALHKAKSTPFDLIELLGMALGLVLVTALTRYQASSLNDLERVAAILINFAVAVPLLVLFVGPFLIRRVRRGLEAELAKRHGHEKTASET